MNLVYLILTVLFLCLEVMSLIIGGEIINMKLEMIYRCKRNTPQTQSLTPTNRQNHTIQIDAHNGHRDTDIHTLSNWYIPIHIEPHTERDTDTLKQTHT